MLSIPQRISNLGAEADEFSPAILQAEYTPPSPLPRLVLYTLIALFGILLLWAIFGRLDIVAVAPGKLVPQTFLKIVQPSDAGVVKEILVKEGDQVAAGQVLMRMDTSIAAADYKALSMDFHLKDLQLRRIDADLAGTPLARKPQDDPALFAQVEAQYRSNRQAYQDALDAERASLSKAQQELQSATEVQAKLKQTLPIYKEQEKGWTQLGEEGFAGKLLVLERVRARIEVEQDLQAQTHNVEGLRSAVAQSAKRVAQLTSSYRQKLQNERIETESAYTKTEQELAKNTYKSGLLELRAPQAGMVKDLATHTSGTVVSPGTVLVTLVPHMERLLAEVWISNHDSGFVVPGQKVKLKLTAYPFQQYGMLEGVVQHVSADASDKPGNSGDLDQTTNESGKSQTSQAPLSYRALVDLSSTELESQSKKFKLTPGMQVNAEVILGSRTVLQYLLSPIQKTTFEAWRER